MIYFFRIRPFLRLFLVAILFWVGFTCLNMGRSVMDIFGVLLLLLAILILRGLLRLSFAYLQTWR